MPRRPLQVTHDLPYHVTSRSNNKEWFYIPLPEVWDIFCEVLQANSALYGTVVHAFVLMGNHYHLILVTPSETLGETMRHILTEVSKRIQKRAHRINHVFGSRYCWSVLDSAYSVAYVYKYVLRNPVRARICSDVKEYPFSSLNIEHWPSLPLAEGTGSLWSLVPKEQHERIHWLNLPVPSEAEELVKNGLRRATFAFSKGNDARKRLEVLGKSYAVRQLRDRYLPGRQGD